MSNLKLTELLVFDQGVAFDTEGIIDASGVEVSQPQGFSDNEALKLLLENKIQRVNLHGTQNLPEARMVELQSMLKEAGISFS